MSGNIAQDKILLSKTNAEIKRLMIDCIYSGRGHQQAGQFWEAVSHWIGIPGAIISSVSGVGAAGAALLGNKEASASLAIISVILAGLNTYLKPKDIADAHLLKGGQYISIRNRTRILKEVELPTGSNQKYISEKLISLRAEYDSLSIRPPRNIPRFAYRAAKKAISEGESDYENDPLWKSLD